MRINNVNLAEAGAFAEQVRRQPDLARKTKRVEGRWVFDQGRPQFSATLAYDQGERTVEADFAPFMGGGGLAPDPIQYCLYGLASCFGGTFVSVAAEKGVELRAVTVVAENRVDLSRALGLSDNPVVEQVSLTLRVEADADAAVLEDLEALARHRCPGVYCLTHPIPLETRVERVS